MKYYAIINDVQRGPFNLDELSDAGVRPSTYVWCKGMQDWEKAEDVADICRMFRIRISNLMHPSWEEAPVKEKPDSEAGTENPNTPSRFDRYLNDSQERLPSPEEIADNEIVNTPPNALLIPAILVTVFCFPPTGALAIYHALAARKSAKADDNKSVKEHTRSAKMFTGISLFLGFIVYSFLYRRFV